MSFVSSSSPFVVDTHPNSHTQRGPGPDVGVAGRGEYQVRPTAHVGTKPRLGTGYKNNTTPGRHRRTPQCLFDRTVLGM